MSLIKRIKGYFVKPFIDSPDLQEVFLSDKIKFREEEKRARIHKEIFILNSEIDEAMDFYFNNDLNSVPSFSWINK